ncbi:hypothetical protein FALCPG4_009242 [Fusarium falciforme]
MDPGPITVKKNGCLWRCCVSEAFHTNPVALLRVLYTASMDVCMQHLHRDCFCATVHRPRVCCKVLSWRWPSLVGFQGSNGRDLKAKTRGELLLVQERLDMPANEQPPVGHWAAAGS